MCVHHPTLTRVSSSYEEQQSKRSGDHLFPCWWEQPHNSAHLMMKSSVSWKLSVICISINTKLWCVHVLHVVPELCRDPYSRSPATSSVSLSWLSLWTQTALLNRTLRRNSFTWHSWVQWIFISAQSAAVRPNPQPANKRKHVKNRVVSKLRQTRRKSLAGNKKASQEDRNQQIHQRHPSTQQLL